MKKIFGIILAIGIVFITQKQIESQMTQFQIWKNKFSIKYNSQLEDVYRQIIFNQNLAKINIHNENKEKTYDMEVNQFTGLTHQQFVHTYLGTINLNSPKNISLVSLVEEKIVGDVDWVVQGFVTSVKNQGSSCVAWWAFSAAGALQGIYKLSTGYLNSFSAQQLIDCSGGYGNFGCNGGLMINAFLYVQSGGAAFEDEYPYRGIKQYCQKDGGSFRISGYANVNDCDNLVTALNFRPLSVAVDATNWSFYRSGIFNNCAKQLNFGALLVGYTNQYWKVKNCWGTSWGQQGYIRLTRGNTCGICNSASYPHL